MKIVASIVLYKHSFKDVEKTLICLLSELSISKVVLVDNGSHCNWLKDFFNEKVDVIYSAENDGFGAGHNQTIERYKDFASHILICNPDIYFEQGEVDKLYSFSIKYQTGLSTPKLVFPDGSPQFGCKLLPTPKQLFMRRFFPKFVIHENNKYELVGADYTKPFHAPSMSGCFMLLSQHALQSIDGFDTRYFMYLEDVDLSRRICSAGLVVLYCPTSTIVHESQRRSYHDRLFLFYHFKSAFQYFNKWGWISDKERSALNSECLAHLNDII